MRDLLKELGHDVKVAAEAPVVLTREAVLLYQLAELVAKFIEAAHPIVDEAEKERAKLNVGSDAD